MGRHPSVVVLSAVILVFAPGRADAAVEWAVWGSPAGEWSVGSFPDGRTVRLKANFSGITAGVPAGSEYVFVDGAKAYNADKPSEPKTNTVDPLFAPGMTNPPFTRIMTGPPGTAIPIKTQVAEVDLSTLPVGAKLALGLADQKSTLAYRLLVRDGAGVTLAAPPEAPLKVWGYSIKYNSSPTYPDGFIADYTSALVDSVFWADGYHYQSGAWYTHTGLSTVEGLPRQAQSVVLRAGWARDDQASQGVQDVEAIQIYVGADFSSIVEIADSQGTPYDMRIAFGEVALASQARHTVTVTNRTQASVNLDLPVAKLPAAPFSVANPSPCIRVLAPGETCTIDVDYAPAATAAAEGSLDFDIDGIPKTVRLSGSGTTAAATGADLRIDAVSAVATVLSGGRDGYITYSVSVTVAVSNVGPSTVGAARLTGSLTLDGTTPIVIDQAIGNLAVGPRQVVVDVPGTLRRRLESSAQTWKLGYDLNLQSVASPPSIAAIDDPLPSNNASAGEVTMEVIGCFIATAAHGSYLDPAVNALRELRDRRLLTNAPGRAFVAWYYRTSPPFAQAISQNEALRMLSRVALTPMVYAVAHPLLAVLAVIGLLAAAATRWSRSSLNGRRSARLPRATRP